MMNISQETCLGCVQTDKRSQSLPEIEVSGRLRRCEAAHAGKAEVYTAAGVPVCSQICCNYE